MDFDLTQRQTELLLATEDIVTKHCSPEREAARDAAPSYPSGLLGNMGAAGLLQFWQDPADGHYLDAALVQERLAYASGTAPVMMFVSSAAISMMSHGERSEFIGGVRERALEGRAAFSFAMTEPQAGSDASGLQTRAVRSGGHFRISGHKLYATGALDADYLLVVARTTADGPAKRGTSIILVPTDSDGVSIKRLDKDAGNAFATCEVIMDDVSVPADHLVGTENGAWRTLFHGGLTERILVAAMACGMAQRAFDAIKSFAAERQQFGQSVLKFQAVAHALADMAADIQAMRQSTFHAAWLAQQGRDCATAINMAKLFASERACRICAKAAQMSGGRGYFRDSVLNRTAREVRLSLYAGGTSQIMRNGITRSFGASR